MTLQKQVKRVLPETGLATHCGRRHLRSGPFFALFFKLVIFILITRFAEGKVAA